MEQILKIGPQNMAVCRAGRADFSVQVGMKMKYVRFAIVANIVAKTLFGFREKVTKLQNMNSFSRFLQKYFLFVIFCERI